MSEEENVVEETPEESVSEESPVIDENLQLGNVENLYTALCIYLGIPSTKDPEMVIATAFAALEYAAITAKAVGIPKEHYEKAAETAWNSVHGNLIEVVKTL